MVRVLFRPFDLGKWFALGFSAWLAGLLDGGGSSGGSGGGDLGGGFGDSETEDVMEDTAGETFHEMVFGVWEAITRFVEEHPWVVPVGIALILIILTIAFVLLWVSSRGKLMFLDNVVRNQAKIGDPWKETGRLGNSLFRWQFVYAWVTLVLFVLLVGGPAYYLIRSFPGQDMIVSDAAWLPVLMGSIVVFLLFLIATSYIRTLLEDFVIPVMYQRSVLSLEAWSIVLGLQREHLGSMVLFVLWKIVLSLLSGFAVIALVLATCCLAILPLAIPYVGAVLLLPVSVFFRSLGPEFLRQFGDEFDLWPEEAAVDAAAGAE